MISACTGIVWDLDDTLYELTHEGGQRWSWAIADGVRAMGVDISREDAHAKSIESFKEFGSGVIAFVNEHKLDPFHLMQHILPYAPIDLVMPCMHTSGMLRRIPEEAQVILTSGYRMWAEKVIEKLQIGDVFPAHRVVTYEDVGFKGKSHPEPFHKAAETLGHDVTRLVMVEDNPNNLKVAKDLGMTTVLVTHGKMQAGSSGHIDHVIERPYDLAGLIDGGKIRWDGQKAGGGG